MSDRRRPFVRSSQPPALVLTERDERLILAVFSYRGLTRPQLQRAMAMPCVTILNDRLRKLFDHGFLDRRRVGTVAMGLQPLYLPGEAAIPLIAARTERPAGEIRRLLREDAQASAMLMPHDIQANDVRLSLTLALQADPGVKFDVWLNARDVYDAYVPGRVLRPDGYFRFWRHGLLHSHFLEVDRGTTSLTRWQTKVERYREYREQGHYSKRYPGLTRFRVLVTALSSARLAHLREATSSVVERGWWFGLTEAVIAMTQATEPLWQPLGHDGKRALVDGKEA
jgi:hypothetical protein